MKSHLAFPHCLGPGVSISLPFPSALRAPALLGSPRIGGQGPIAFSEPEPKAELSSLSNYPTPIPSEAPGPAGATAELFSFIELQFQLTNILYTPKSLSFPGTLVQSLPIASYPGSPHHQPRFPLICLCTLCVFWVSRQAATALPLAHFFLLLNSRGHFRSFSRALVLQPPPYPQTSQAA